MTRRRRGAGMTLLEVLIALALASIGLLGALAMVGASMRGGSFARNMTEASVLARSKLESLVIMPGVTLSSPVNNSSTVESTLDQYGNTVSTPAGIYTRTTTWGMSPDGLRRSIKVQVQWYDALHASHTVTAQRERSP